MMFDTSSPLIVIVDGESSSTSTLPVHPREACHTNNAWTGKISLTIKQQPKKSCKSVRFNNAANQEYDADVQTKSLSKQERKALLWYSKQDYTNFRQATNQLARQIAKAEQANPSPTSYRKTLRRAFEACCDCPVETTTSVLTANEDRVLKRRLAESVRLVGMEKYVVTQMNQGHLHRYKRLIRTVQQIQASNASDDDSSQGDYSEDSFDSSSSSTTSDSSSLYSLEEEQQDLASVLQHACRKMTRPSRLFARHVAQSHAAASNTSTTKKKVRSNSSMPVAPAETPEFLFLN